MNIDIHVSGGSADQVRAALHELLHGTVIVYKQEEPKGVETPKPTTEPAQPEVTQPVTRKGRGKANKADTVVNADVEDAVVLEETRPGGTVVEGDPVTTKDVTADDIKWALKAMMKAKGENEVFGVLKKHGAKNRSELMASGNAPKAYAEIEAEIGADAITAEKDAEAAS